MIDEGIEPVARATVVEGLTDVLIDAVVGGRFPPGSPLPPERELAQQLDVNRSTLRQAVARLEQIGLLTRRQGSGTVVVDPRSSSAPDVVARLGADDRVALVADLLEVREALATVIGRRAGARLTDADVVRLRALCDDVAAAGSPRQRQVLELAFFGVLVEVGGNRAIAALLRWVADVYAGLGPGGARVADAVPSFTAAFTDGDLLATHLRGVVDAHEAGGDLAAALTAYATWSGARLLDAARVDRDG